MLGKYFPMTGNLEVVPVVASASPDNTNSVFFIRVIFSTIALSKSIDISDAFS